MARHQAKNIALPTKGQLKATREFIAQHGKPAKAVVENLGRAGARVVLIGADGALGDVVVEDLQLGEALVNAVADLDSAKWDPTTVNAVTIGPLHRRRMAALGTPKRIA
jgi:hypothetical protein